MKEVEAALVVLAEDPAAVTSKIAALKTVLNYSLIPKPPMWLWNCYFDFSNSALQSRQFALRLREAEGSCRVTLKGPPVAKQGGAIERLEVEMPWSPGCVAQILHEFVDAKLPLHQGAALPETCDINLQAAGSQKALIGAMGEMGLRVIHEHATNRQIRQIQTEGGEIVAELAIDAVVYPYRRKGVAGHQHASDRNDPEGERLNDLNIEHITFRPPHSVGSVIHTEHVRHYEVEVESKSDQIIARIVAHLLTMYRPALRIWDYSKLETGRAIRQLASEGRLDELLLPDHHLSPKAYPLIGDLCSADAASRAIRSQMQP